MNVNRILQHEPTMRNRAEAGITLAPHLQHLDHDAVTLVSISEHSAEVAQEIAEHLDVPHLPMFVRPLYVPDKPPHCFGAFAEGDHYLLDHDMIRSCDVDLAQVETILDQLKQEYEQWQSHSERQHPCESLHGRIAVVIDDVLNCALTIQVATQAVRTCDPSKIIIAAPVASPDLADALQNRVDEVICPLQPRHTEPAARWFHTPEPVH